jgi:hypothetical protein
MRIHSAVGRRLGIGAEDIDKLVALDRKDFEYREWLALRFVQDFAFLGGEVPAGDYMEDFNRLYAARERKYILKLARMMRFANYWNNTLRGMPWRASLESQTACSVRPKDSESARRRDT